MRIFTPNEVRKAAQIVLVNSESPSYDVYDILCKEFNCDEFEAQQLDELASDILADAYARSH